MEFVDAENSFEPVLRLPLHAHAATPTLAVRSMHLALGRDAADNWRFDLEVNADLTRLLVPAATSPGFSDGLWRHTCFELFAADEQGRYREFNFSPSSRFAIYDFGHYRSGMSAVVPPAEPFIDPRVEGLLVRVFMPGGLLVVAGGPVLALGAAAVIEERGGALSYWALSHPGKKPDFHHRDGFVVSWPPRGGAEER